MSEKGDPSDPGDVTEIRTWDIVRVRGTQAVLMGSAFTLSATAAAYLIFRWVLAGASVCVTIPP